MRPCPTCGEPGIREHSVLIPLAVDDSVDADELRSPYARCARCDAVFRHVGPDTLVPQPPETLGERTLYVIPPWKERTDASAFEMSWDVADAFFEDQSVEIEWVRPVFRLVCELRAAGLDSQLRAGQSLNALGLSRSREHGLRPEQSQLFLSPQADGSIVVTGSIRGKSIRFGPVEPKLDGPLQSAIEDLISVTID